MRFGEVAGAKKQLEKRQQVGTVTLVRMRLFVVVVEEKKKWLPLNRDYQMSSSPKLERSWHESHARGASMLPCCRGLCGLVAPHLPKNPPRTT